MFSLCFALFGGFFYTLILIGVFCYLVLSQDFNLFGGVIYTSIRYIFLPF